MVRYTYFMLFCAALFFGAPLHAGETTVRNDDQLHRALKDLKPGDTVNIAPGNYRGGVWLREVSGTKDRRIVIQGADDDKPPVFQGGGKEAWHLADCNYVTLRNLTVKGFAGNGINADDGGTFETPSRGMVFEKLTIVDTGPRGNHDALKLSGLDDLTVRNCSFEGWGGSAIDMVGCHGGVVEDCTFTGKPGFTQANAVQLKGGTTDILVQTSRFVNCGHRSVNLGGSTGLQYFRPKVGSYEAKDIVIAGNTFVGSTAPVAWVTSQNGFVHHNTIVLPDKWALRILQENNDPRIEPCSGGRFEDNLVIFDGRLRVFVNIGPNTKPKSFSFARNAWVDTAGGRRPQLPTREVGGIYDLRVEVKDFGKPTMTVTSKDPRLKTVGADAYEKPTRTRSRRGEGGEGL